MKFIRTKTNLFEVVGENALVFKVKGKRDSEKIYSVSKRYGKIIKQANTIEELCSEFVIKGTRGLYLGIPLQECELRNIPITQIYGAIWTDKGLIYVAKMNEKGELELL